MIVTEALNGNLTVYVDKQAVHISFASSRTGGIIIEPPVIIDRFDNEKYAIIGGVLGTILLVAVVITVTLIVIVTFYRRYSAVDSIVCSDSFIISQAIINSTSYMYNPS